MSKMIEEMYSKGNDVQKMQDDLLIDLGLKEPKDSCLEGVE